MLGRILLDNDYFLVTAGLLGAIKVTLKSRGLTLKATREERTKLLDVLDELKRRGYSVEPDSKEFEEILDGFSEALLGRGGFRWQAYFLVTTCENIVNGVVGESVNSNTDAEKVDSSVFKVYVDDNFHYMDESERYTYGEYETYEEAVDACKAIVDEEIEAFKNNDSNMDVYGQHCSFGEDPWVMPVPEGKEMFSARDYVYQKCKKNTKPAYSLEDYPKPKEEDYKTTEEFEEAHAWWMKRTSQFMRKVPGVIQTEQTTEDSKASESRNDFRIDWEKVNKVIDNLTPEEWEKHLNKTKLEEERKARKLKPEVDDYKLADIAYENWKEEAKERVKKIKDFVVDGQVKFEDVEELGYEIKDFISISEEWCEGDLIYDFTTEAQQLLNNLNISSVGKK